MPTNRDSVDCRHAIAAQSLAGRARGRHKIGQHRCRPNWIPPARVPFQPLVTESGCERCCFAPPAIASVTGKSPQYLLVQVGCGSQHRHARTRYCRSDRSRMSRAREVSICRRRFVSRDRGRSSSTRFSRHHPFRRLDQTARQSSRRDRSGLEMPGWRRRHRQQTRERPPVTPQSRRRWRRTGAVEFRATREGRGCNRCTRCRDRRP